MDSIANQIGHHMKHAFVMNGHKDIPQMDQCTELIFRYWSDQSKLILYLDGPEYSHDFLQRVQSRTQHLYQAPYERDKCASIIQALNYLYQYAVTEKMDVISFLHADMIPLQTERFYNFLSNFYLSEKAFSFSPLSFEPECIDFCNLHFNIAVCKQLKLFPISLQSSIVHQNDLFNENILTQHFAQCLNAWGQYGYSMMMISDMFRLNPYHGVQGSFIFHNYTLASSIVHTNDPQFWEQYDVWKNFNGINNQPFLCL